MDPMIKLKMGLEEYGGPCPLCGHVYPTKRSRTINPIVFVAHPVSGDVTANLAKARSVIRKLEEEHPKHTFVAPWILSCENWDDGNVAEREQQIQRGLRVLEMCDELWLCGSKVSAGMLRETAHAIQHKLVLKDLTTEKRS